MAKYTQRETLKVTQPLDPVGRQADATSSEIDTQGYQSYLIVASVGSTAQTLSTAVYIAFELEESDTSGSGFTDVADADMDAAGATTDANGEFARVDAAGEVSTAYTCSYKGSKRYLQVKANHSGSFSSDVEYSILAVGGNGDRQPESNS